MRKWLLLRKDTTDQMTPFLSWCGFFLMGYYTLFNYVDHGVDHLPFLFTLVSFFALGVIAPYTRFKRFSKVLLLVPTQVFMTDLIFWAGGLRAPGVFWLSAMPIVWALLYQIRGLLVGLVITLMTYGYFWMIEEGLPLTEFFPSMDAIERARLENLVLFTLFMASFVMAYTIVILQSQKKVTEKQKEVEALLRILVHDISNPLMIIHGNLTMSQRKGVENETALRSTERIQEIIHDVRRLFTLRDKKANIELVPTQVKSCVNEAVEIVQQRCREKQVLIEVVSEVDRRDLILDRSLFVNQVCVNILGNAIKFSSPGGRIFIRLYENQDSVVLEFEDEGIGIPGDLIPHLFSTVARTTRKGTSGEPGTGYGLPIVWEVVNLLGGHIQVFSPPQDKATGTLFRLWFKK